MPGGVTVMVIRENLLLYFLDALGLDLVHQSAEDDSILENLGEVSRGKLFIKYSLDPLGNRTIESTVLCCLCYNCYTAIHCTHCRVNEHYEHMNKRYLQNLLLLLRVPGCHYCLKTETSCYWTVDTRNTAVCAVNVSMCLLAVQ